jgi:hypothetical protein
MHKEFKWSKGISGLSQSIRTQKWRAQWLEHLGASRRNLPHYYE